jgi:hypothetical protein
VLGPSLTQTAGEPRIGSSYQLTLGSAPRLTPALSLIGASRTAWGAFALPLDLGPLGAPGCSVLASADVAVGGVTDAFGRMLVNFAVPNDPVLLDVTIYHQSVVADPSANTLGIALTNGLAQLLGGG